MKRFLCWLAAIVIVIVWVIPVIASAPTVIRKENEVIEEIIVTEPTELTEEEHFFENYDKSKELMDISTIPPLRRLPRPTKPEPEPEPENKYPSIDENSIYWYNSNRTWTYGEVTTTIGGYDFDIDFLAKLLFAEAGSMGWTGQVYVCSAILNLCDLKAISLWEAGHTTRIFSVAPYVDNVQPLERQYEVIDYVLNGGRVMGVCYFRTNYYHGFGTPVCQIENVCFSYR